VASGLVCGVVFAEAGVASEDAVTWPDVEAVAVGAAEVLGSDRLGWNGDWRSGIRIGILLATGAGSESSSIGNTTTAARIRTTAPAKRRLALMRKSAAWASLVTEGRGLPMGLREGALSFLENSPI
jgi:hypothetical protein